MKIVWRRRVDERVRQSVRRPPSAVVVMALAVTGLMLSSCEDDFSSSSALTVEAIQSDLAAYEDEQVTVLAEVQEIVSPFAYSIRGTTDAFTEPILVVAADDWSDLEPDVPVRVEGELRTGLVLVELEELLNQDLDDQTYAAWESGVYIVAEHSERADDR